VGLLQQCTHNSFCTNVVMLWRFRTNGFSHRFLTATGRWQHRMYVISHMIYTYRVVRLQAWPTLFKFWFFENFKNVYSKTVLFWNPRIIGTYFYNNEWSVAIRISVYQKKIPYFIVNNLMNIFSENVDVPNAKFKRVVSQLWFS